MATLVDADWLDFYLIFGNLFKIVPTKQIRVGVRKLRTQLFCQIDDLKASWLNDMSNYLRHVTNKFH